ncbi:hypothetical protein IX332_001231 [Porphyromonas levii]|nr:restriction endonuclease subunit S [Porphyromonas levii]MBR8702968.1 hypothetical protein [Porphyromonas levii]MBR8729907.1 hypothetical protein [Porphyromonas levii]MBR8760154.1 hypothetical protein [Porphyromonas levii]MBR8769619.1 hypothetical protein [Porphyromonas levii]MBR8773717.1 hypothetical protein [Porphyromonas levii]
MKRYEKYKESGISWIGEIPEHWEVRKIKYVFTERSEKGYPNEPVLCSTQKYGVIPQSIYENRVVEVNKGHEGLKLVKEGNFVISLRSFQGGIEYAYYRGIISAAYTVLELNHDYSSEYLRYLLKSFPFIQLLQTCVTGIREGQNINFELLRKNFLLLPPPHEQETIVAYLEEKVAQMDNLVAKQESQIAYLRELKQAVIAKAVTQGLDPQAPLQPSGISWIGNIPEHWEVRMLSQLSQNYFISNKDIKHQNLLSLSYGRIIQKDINTTEGLLPASYDTYQVIRRENIVLRLTDLQNDHKSLRVGLCMQEGIITSAYLTLASRSNVKPEFLYFLLHTADIKKVFYGMGSGLRQNLNWKELRKLSLPLPPLSEQEAIVTYIHRKTEEIDRLIAMTEQEIARVRELKQTLIADVVTGRVNVQPS